MADLVSPDQIRSRSFRTTFRGFDQAEVAEFLDRVSRTVEHLDRERARVGSEADEQTDGDLQTEFQRVSAEIGTRSRRMSGSIRAKSSRPRM